MTDELVGWHHRLDGHEFEQVPGDGDGQGSLGCGSPQGRRESDMTEQLNSRKHPACTGRLRSGCPSQALETPEEGASAVPGEILVPIIVRGGVQVCLSMMCVKGLCGCGCVFAGGGRVVLIRAVECAAKGECSRKGNVQEVCF